MSESEGASSPGRRARLRLLLLGSGAVVAGAVVAIIVLTHGGPSTAAGSTSYQISAPAVAGGWTTAPDSESVLSTSEASRLQQLMDGEATKHVAAVYADPAGGQQVVFDGAAGSLGDPATLITRLHTDPAIATQGSGLSVAWTEVPAGPHGGRAACGDVTAASDPSLHFPVCVWQTTTSFGQLVPLSGVGAPVAGTNSGSMTAQALADLMLRMRLDVETTG